MKRCSRSSNVGVIRCSVVLAAIMLPLIGCGTPPTVITGLVSFQGKPLSNATLEFFPISGRGRVSFTKTDQSGRYAVEVSPTPLKVVVSATKVDGKQKNPFDPEGLPVDRVVSALPTKYGYQEKTPLAADPVEGKTTTIDFSLESSGK